MLITYKYKLHVGTLKYDGGVYRFGTWVATAHLYYSNA